MNSRRLSQIIFTFLFFFISFISAASTDTVNENVLATDDIDGSEVDKRAARPFTSGSYGDFYNNDLILIPDAYDSSFESYAKRASPAAFGNDIPGVLRFGKRSQSFIRFGRSDLAKLIEKKQVPGVLRFGKRSDMPGVLRFGKRSDMPGVLRFGKRASLDGGDEDIQQEKKAVPGVLRFGKRSDMPGVLRFGKRSSDMPGVLRFGKRSDMPGVLRFGKRSSDMPGVLRFGKRSDMPGVLRFGKRFEFNFLDKKSEMPGVLRFGKK
uniref:Uncharacterized protein n=1 Tax=Panagrolaimus sp. ES5 TaxID=591445 RepID=A0AC34F2E6_9BILA